MKPILTLLPALLLALPVVAADIERDTTYNPQIQIFEKSQTKRLQN